MTMLSDTWDLVEGGSEARDYAFIAHLAEDIAGLSLPPCKAPMMRARLLKRLRALNLPSIGAYREFLGTEAGANERSELILALTTNVTNFYREIHHFDFFRDEVLPDLIAFARKGGRVRLWSAGCSTGEEPVSLSMDLLASCPEAAELDIRILATDIDTEVLRRARAASYAENALEPLIARHGSKDLIADPERLQNRRISDRVTSLITYRTLNLVQPWPMQGPFQVVFCRNVLIYFGATTQSALWPQFKSVLDTGGYLFLGHSERLEFPKRHGATAVATTTYRFA